MKKTLSLLLALVMCLSLCACGSANTSAKKEIVGAWNAGGYDIFVFSEDGKVTRGDYQYDWWYDETAEKYCFSFNGFNLAVDIEEDENGKFFNAGGARFSYIENYDAESTKAEYIAEQVALLTKDKTELLPGNTYTTESGIVFAFEKAEIIEDEETTMLGLYISSEDSLYFNNESYDYMNGYARSGMMHLNNLSTETTVCYAYDLFGKTARFEKDCETYGILSFSIDGTPYYVSINTFFE